MSAKKIVMAMLLLHAATSTASIETAVFHNQQRLVLTLLDKHLAYQADDRSALFLKAMYAHALRLKEAERDFNALAAYQPSLGRCLKQIFENVDKRLSFQLPEPLNDAVIITLGYPSEATGQPGPLLSARLQKTLRLARRYPKLPILVTGAAAHNTHVESTVMKQWLIEHQVDASRIITETRARDTIENARFSLPLLPANTKKIILVTNAFHMKRSLMIFDAVMKSKRIKIYSASAENNLNKKELTQNIGYEHIAAYRDRARALDLLHFKHGKPQVQMKPAMLC